MYLIKKVSQSQKKKFRRYKVGKESGKNTTKLSITSMDKMNIK